jgi:DNA-binding NarL/FixJ family response regulator
MLTIMRGTRSNDTNKDRSDRRRRDDNGGLPGTESLDGAEIPRAGEPTIVIIDRRALPRECLARSLQAATSDDTVLTFPSVDQWTAVASQYPSVSLILLCTGGRKTGDEESERDLALLLRAPHDAPVILLSDAEDISQVLQALDSGAQGYIPTSLTLDVAIEAMRLVRAGGIYVPASSFLRWRQTVENTAAPPQDGLSSMFTTRQAAVLRALREGKANKVIAYELNMKESTVKVHVRNIMKKVKARNRTEVAYLVNGIFMDTNHVRETNARSA